MLKNPFNDLNDAGKKMWNEVMNEWSEKIKTIKPKYSHNILDNGSNGKYTDLEKIYIPKLQEIYNNYRK